MASFWDNLFGRKEEPKAKPAAKSSQSRSAPSTSRRGGGGEGESSGSTFRAGTGSARPTAAPNELSAPSSSAPTSDVEKERLRFLETEEGKKYSESLPQLSAENKAPEGWEAPAPKDGKESWFSSALKDASTPVGGKSLAHEADKLDEKSAVASDGSRLIPGRGKPLTGELTEEAYNALAPRQRAAVDFNTALQKAVAEDLANPGVGDAAYEDKVSSLFGEKGGSDRYAPRTVELLQAFGMGDTAKGDLDNYLDLTMMIRDDDLAKLTDDQIEGLSDSKDPWSKSAVDTSERAQSSLSSILASGQTLLNQMKTSNPALFGEPAVLLGTGSEAVDSDLDALFKVMAGQGSRDVSEDEVKGYVGDIEREYGLANEDIREYLDRRLASDSFTPDGGRMAADIRARYFTKAG